MLYILLGLTFCFGILIHLLVIHLPIILQRSWTQDCVDYLKSIQPLKTTDNRVVEAQFTKVKWRFYFPFASMRFILLDGVLFASSLFIFYHFDGYLYWASGLLFTWLLMVSSFIDFEHQILPDEISYILLWLGLVCSCWNLYTYSTGAILGVLVAYLSLWTISFLFKLIRKKEGIGQGDLKLFAAIAAWTGVLYLPLILFIASVSSVIYILLRKLFTGKSCATSAPFGPFLALSGWLALLWGHALTSLIIY